MTTETTTETTVPTTDVTERTVTGPPARERVVERLVPVEDGRRRWFVPFLAGVLTTAIAAALGFGLFLALSDADDDGNLQVDVPAVDLEVGS